MGWKFWLFQIVWGLLWGLFSVVAFTVIIDQIGK